MSFSAVGWKGAGEIAQQILLTNCFMVALPTIMILMDPLVLLCKAKAVV
jgi:hypothetical protein